MTPVLDYVSAWTFNPDYSTPWDHELITFDIENLDSILGTLRSSKETIGWMSD